MSPTRVFTVPDGGRPERVYRRARLSSRVAYIFCQRGDGRACSMVAMTPPRLLRLAPAPAAHLEERTDDELMTLAQAGLREAFAVLVRRHARRVLQTCSRFANDAEASAELAQETWVAVWTHRSEYRPDGKFIVWLITACRNRCRNHLRAKGVARRYAERSAPAREGLPPDQIDALLVEERRRRVRDELQRIPAPMREALLLRYGEDLRYDEMAKVVRTGESTLRSRVHHGLKLLRNLLEKNR